VRRSPEVLHGLGNLIENAAEFAASRVRIDLWWNAAELGMNITDDGPGFPLSVIDMLGEPYFSHRPREEGQDEKGLGLGVFIAKTLLERTGATVTFSNAPGGGAVVRLAWPRAALAAEPS
jgi:two-component system sensor histidine kinase RegB